MVFWWKDGEMVLLESGVVDVSVYDEVGLNFDSVLEMKTCIYQLKEKGGTGFVSCTLEEV